MWWFEPCCWDCYSTTKKYIQIYIYNLYMSFPCLQKKNRPSAAPGPRLSCALALCRGSRSASELPRPRRSRCARALRRWFLWWPPVRSSAVETDLAAFQKGQPGRTLKKCSIDHWHMLVGGDWNHGILWLSIQLGIIIPTDFHIFQRGSYTTN